MEIENNNSFISFDNAKKEHFGSCSEIYVQDDLAIKKYYDDKCPKYFGRLDKNVFETLKTIDSNSFIKLIDYYSKEDYVGNDYQEVLTGYTYKYVNEINQLMIDMPMGYTLNTLYEFRLLLEYLNGNHLIVREANARNVVKSEKNLVIIDPDSYCFDDVNYKDNLKMLNNYVSKLWFQEYGSYSFDDYQKIAELFNYKDSDTYLKEMYEKLKGDTPRDLLDKVFDKKTRRLFVNK